MAFEIESSTILTNEQLQNHVKIYAGPGAGKTHFLVENVKNIVITNSIISKSNLRKVLCITYTNAAVEEIIYRLNRLSDSVEVFTIHGFIIEHIIKPFQIDLRRVIKEQFDIDIEGNKAITSQIEGVGILHGVDKEEIYKFIIDETGETTSPTYSKKLMGDVQVDNKLFLDNGKIYLSASKSIEENHKLPIKKYVWSKLRKLTHDEILFFGYQILKTNPTALYSLRVKFPFIFIDEFQDTNPLQTILIKLIGLKSSTIGIIGDIAQSIYSFQGARPTQFSNFTLSGERQLSEFVINGNRRSTSNIVNFCNFLRQSDTSVIQTSIRPYDSDEKKDNSEQIPVQFLIGDSETVKSTIASVIERGGVVLTRAWANAFAYIRDIDDNQIQILTKIYNSYYNSPIDIRSEITEMNNVTWVRAFKFIFTLHEAYENGSFVDVLNAFKLYTSIDRRKLNHIIVRQIIGIIGDAFKELTDSSSPVEVITGFNNLLDEIKYKDLRILLLGEDFNVPIFDEYDLENGKPIVENLKALTWSTSFKLFTEVFSVGSKYMTVHQAKGLEWDEVIVSVNPNRFDKIKLPAVYNNPEILREEISDEFVRMYYVACSRARDCLYIHLPSEFNRNIIDTALKNWNVQYEITI
ncbi:MAG: ATP-dependent helicase [Erysipelotrichia bacterium]|nr:ATP-dependent helicase [Erysipelotrichia bacterium]